MLRSRLTSPGPSSACEAAERQAERGSEAGEAVLRRVELLRLRFHEGLPIREIRRRWGSDPDAVHRDYARARREFQMALAEVVARHHPGSTPVEIEHECACGAFGAARIILRKKSGRKTSAGLNLDQKGGDIVSFSREKEEPDHGRAKRRRANCSESG